MLSFKECYEIAKRNKSRINACTEYTNAYAFFWEEGDAGSDGGDSPIVIRKEDGRTMNMIEYAITPGKEYVGSVDIVPHVR